MLHNAILLTRTQLLGLFFSGKSNKKNQASILPFLVSLCAMVYLSSLYSNLLFSSLPPELSNLGLYTMISACFTMLLILSFTASQGMLFGFKDYDFLMSLPVKKSDIVISKLASFLLYLYMYAFVLVTPCIVIYGMKFGTSPLFYVLAFFGFLTLPCIPMILGSLVGLVIRSATAKMKHKEMLNGFFMLLFIAGIMVFSFSMNSVSDSQAVQQLSNLGKTLSNIVLPVTWYVNACVYLNPIQFALCTLVPLFLLAAFVGWISPLLLKASAAGEQGYHVKNFKIRSVEKQSIFKALFKREWTRFINNPNYVINTTFSLLFLAGGSIYLAFNPTRIAQVHLLLQDMEISLVDLNAICIASLASILQISSTTAVSISLEGKKLWILKTMPVSTIQIFHSKISINMAILLAFTIPSYLLVTFRLGMPMLSILLGIVAILLLSAFSSLIGLVLNLQFPKLEFTREITVIKQSASEMILVFGGMLIGVGLVLCCLALLQSSMSGNLIVILLCGLVLLLDGVLYYRITHRGVKQFSQMN